MALSARERRVLAARGNRLRPAATLGDRELTESMIESVRRLLRREELVKVRVATQDRAAFAAMSDALAARVPCELVQRIGRVMLLYRPREEGEQVASA